MAKFFDIGHEIASLATMGQTEMTASNRRGFDN